jgi:hypothetical protein
MRMAERTRKVTKRQIGDIWATDLQRHAISRETQLRRSKLPILASVEVILGVFTWIQNGELGAPDATFDLFVLVNGFTEWLGVRCTV